MGEAEGKGKEGKQREEEGRGEECNGNTIIPGGLSKGFTVLFQKDLREYRSHMQMNIVQL